MTTKTYLAMYPTTPASQGQPSGPATSIVSTASTSQQAEIAAACNTALASIGSSQIVAPVNYEGDDIPARGQALVASSDVFTSQV